MHQGKPLGGRPDSFSVNVPATVRPCLAGKASRAARARLASCSSVLARK